MNNIKDFDDWLNEGLKDKLKRGWEKFKDDLHPWDYTKDEWEKKWGPFDNKKSKSKIFSEKPKSVNTNPFDEEDWVEGKLPENPYSISEFNEMIRNNTIQRTTEEQSEFLWRYKNGKVLYFKKREPRYKIKNPSEK